MHGFDGEAPLQQTTLDNALEPRSASESAGLTLRVNDVYSNCHRADVD